MVSAWFKDPQPVDSDSPILPSANTTWVGCSRSREAVNLCILDLRDRNANKRPRPRPRNALMVARVREVLRISRNTSRSESSRSY